MFEQLFGSKTRAKLIKIFLENPEKAFYVRELTRTTGSMINSVRRELKILEELGIVYVEQNLIQKNIAEMNLPEGLNTKKFFKLNTQNVFHKELKDIFKKNHLVSEKQLADEIKDTSNVYLVILVGCFIKDKKSPTDVLIVSDLNKKQLASILRPLQKKARIDREINYTILTEQEYYLRKDINDRFLYSIINHPKKIILLDKFKEKQVQL